MVGARRRAISSATTSAGIRPTSPLGTCRGSGPADTRRPTSVPCGTGSPEVRTSSTRPAGTSSSEVRVTSPTSRPASIKTRSASVRLTPTSPPGTGRRNGPSDTSSRTVSPAASRVPASGRMPSTSPESLPSWRTSRVSTVHPNSVRSERALSPEDPTRDGTARRDGRLTSHSMAPPTTAPTVRIPARSKPVQRRRGPTGRGDNGAGIDGSVGDEKTVGVARVGSPSTGEAPTSPGPTSGKGSGRDIRPAMSSSMRPSSRAVGRFAGSATPAWATTGTRGPRASGMGTSCPIRAASVPSRVSATNGRWPVMPSTMQRARA